MADFSPAHFVMSGVTPGVTGENYSKFRKTKAIKKYRKTLVLSDFAVFLVEISGIEPLTS